MTAQGFTDMIGIRLFTIKDQREQVVQQDNYYPFGLTLTPVNEPLTDLSSALV